MRLATIMLLHLFVGCLAAQDLPKLSFTTNGDAPLSLSNRKTKALHADLPAFALRIQSPSLTTACTLRRHASPHTSQTASRTSLQREWTTFTGRDPKGRQVIGLLRAEEIKCLIIDQDQVLELAANPYGEYALTPQPPSAVPFICQTSDDQNVGVPSHTAGPRAARSVMAGDCLELYLEVDHQTYLDLGSSTTAVEAWLAALTTPVISQYKEIGIPIQVRDVFIWDMPDPYTSTTTLGALQDFKAHRQNNYDGRVPILLSTRALGGGLADGIGGLCGSFPNGASPYIVAANLESTINGLPNYNYSVHLLTHEIGHVIGARHTHACVWNGNDTQIDDCGNVYAYDNGLYPEGEACFDTLNPVLPMSGSIMSHCNLTPTGVMLSNGFHQQVALLLNGSYSNASCVTGAICQASDPGNDNCSGAISVDVTHTCVPMLFDNYNAKSSGVSPGFSCGSTGTTKDVWFTTIVPPSGSVTIETTQVSNGLNNTVVQVYRGSCGSLISLACDDNSGSGNHALIQLTGRPAGEQLWIRVIESGSNAEGLFGLCVYDASIACHPQYDDLVAIYNSTAGSSWLNRSGWEQGALGNDCDVCSWYGVTCNINEEVVQLDLSANNLQGSLPSNLGNLTTLLLLDMSENGLGGATPASMGQLDNLLYLDMGNNALTGNLPTWLTGLDAIGAIYLDSNALTGPIPMDVGSIAGLNVLHLQSNNLSGCIPTSLDTYCPLGDINVDENPSLAGSGFTSFCDYGDGADYDGDGFCAGDGANEDCRDQDANTYPGAPEICDGYDNNCDGVTDDGVAQVNTWSGGAVGQWHTPMSWSLGMVPAACHDAVIGSGASVEVEVGMSAVARSLLLEGGVVFTQSGGLILRGSEGHGAAVESGATWVNNAKTLIGDAAGDGLHLMGIFTNNDSLVIDHQVDGAGIWLSPVAQLNGNAAGRHIHVGKDD